MKKSEKQGIYIATKLFSFFDRQVSELICESVESMKEYNDYDVYLPFRDSNNIVGASENAEKQIFVRDIEALEKCDFLICRLDGLSYDAGIGFEIGFCYNRHIPIVVFNTDFYETKVREKKLDISVLLGEISTVRKYRFHRYSDISYKDELKRNIRGFKEYICTSMREVMRKSSVECFDVNVQEPKKCYDAFIDICGLKYEWCSFIKETIESVFESYGKSCYVSSRYLRDSKARVEFDAIESAAIFVTCFDENEPDLDSCILLGYAYRAQKKILAYESNPVVHYVEGAQKMGVNFMLEQSCDYISRSLKELCGMIVEIYDEK